MDWHIQISETPAALPERQMDTIYCVEGVSGKSKIGHSRNVRNRAASAVRECRFARRILVLRHESKLFRALEMEKALHKAFSAKHITGEWFGVSAADVERAIRDLDPSTFLETQQQFDAPWRLFEAVTPRDHRNKLPWEA